MKNKNSKNLIKRILVITVTLVILLIISCLGYSYWEYRKPFNINSLDFSGWNKSDHNLGFLFTLNDIPICKKFINSYESNSNIFKWRNSREPISSDEIQSQINTQPEVIQITKQLKKQRFKKVKSLSGLSQDNYGGNYPNIRYLITYQKNNTFCQIHETFECNSNGCYGLYSYFGCGQFDLEKDFQVQKQYYDIYQKTGKKISNTEHFVNIEKNDKYIFLSIDQITDGVDIYINKQNNKVVCAGKVCCNTYSKDDPKIFGDWCTDDYQTIETYQPIGL